MKYKVAYSHIANAGDLLNVYILEKIFGIEIEPSGYLSADLVGIGSCLGEYQYSKDFIRRTKQSLFSNKKTYVWGTGFIFSDKTKEEPFYNKNLIFSALRGQLSKDRVERLTGKDLGNIPLCDGGILTSKLFDKTIQKKYELGVIPHYKEQEEPIFRKLLNISKNSVLIDLKRDPMEVYKTIASCECVLSSSLHGLIISDSFNIPNLHVKVSDKLLGDGFKFKDYYSGYGLEDNYVKPEVIMPSINDIINNYKIDPIIVKDKMNQMIQCFPFTKS